MKNTVIILSIFIVCVLSSFLLGRNLGRKSVLGCITEKVDTLVIRDTITQIRPVSRIVRVVDSIMVTADTIRVHDTLYMYLPREERVYENHQFRAVVSGFRPSLDTMQIYTDKEIVTRTVVQSAPKLSFGCYAGYGVQYGFKGFDAGFQLGVGITYRF